MALTGLKAALATVVDPAEVRSLTKAWADEQPEAVQRVNQLLRGSGVPGDVIAAHTLAVNISIYSALDELGVRANTRQHAVLREFDRHRAEKRSQQAYEDVIDAEYQVVPDPETSRSP